MGPAKKDKNDLLIHCLKTHVDHKQVQRLQRLLEQSRYRNMSQLLRAIITKEPIVTYTKDASLGIVMEELVQLRKELNAIGNNLNQVARHLNSLRPQDHKVTVVVEASLVLSQVESKIEKIYPIISQLALKWLQK